MTFSRIPIRISLAPVIFGVALFLVLVSPGRAETVGEGADHEALKADAKKTFKEKVEPFVKKYCARCHGSRPKAGINLVSSAKDPGSTSAALHWKKSVANVKVHDMPPDDADNIPTDDERHQFIEWISILKHLSPKDPGPFVIRRLTKAEYGNTLRDLYGVDPAIAEVLPEEVFGQGYLNSISPLQSELFLGIANDVLNRVVAPEGKAPTETQKRLFGETPAEGADLRAAARRVAHTLARDAYRRPATDAELDVLVSVFDLGRENDLGYTASLGLMLKAILVSPQFLFITPGAMATDLKDPIVPLGDHRLASRLSYLLWASPPDAELSALADKGALQKPDVLQAQVQRLLDHPRARALFDGFGAQWLGLGELEHQTFDPKLFPQMTPELRTAMVDEARLFFMSVVRENQRAVRFVDSDYTFLNGDLAKLYGMESSVHGPEMRRVELKNPNRGGILGMPAALATTSFPNRTSPVRRAVCGCSSRCWANASRRRRLMCPSSMSKTPKA